MARRLADFAEAEERRESIQEAAADFLGREWSLRALRERVERDDRADAPEIWQRIRELGWTDFSVSGTIDRHNQDGAGSGFGRAGSRIISQTRGGGMKSSGTSLLNNRDCGMTCCSR